MSCKKNIFSYMMWMIYTLAVGSGLFCIVAFIGSGAGRPLYQSVLMSAGVLFLAGLCVFFLNRISGKLLGERAFEIPHRVRTEKVVLILLMAAGAWLRIYYASPEPEDVTGYFETVKVSVGNALPQVVHGAEYFYLLFLRGVCIMFGNRLSVCLAAQIVLQFLAGLALYLGVRRLAGVIPALTMLAFMMFSGFMVKETLILSPRPLYLLLYGAGFVLVSNVLKIRKSPVSVLMAGFVTGFLVYLDILGITLLPIILSAFWLFPENNEVKEGGKRVIYSFGITLAGVAAGFFVCTVLDSVLSGAAWGNVVSAWGRLYAPKGFIMPVFPGNTENYIELLLLAGMLSLGIFSFYCCRYRERISVWCLMGIMIAAGSCTGCLTGRLPGYDLLYLLMAVLAGVGLSGIAYDSGMTEEEPGPEEEMKPEQEKQEGTAGRSEEPQLQYIENPLPLPKKHERKVLDYDYFVADDDDFDYP